MEEEFRIGEQGIKDIRKNIWSKILPSILLAMTVGLAIHGFNPNSKHSADEMIWSNLVIIPVLLMGLSFHISRVLKRKESYRIVLKDSVIVREQFDTPTIAIPYDEITSVKKVSSGAMVIQGKSSTESIIVSPYLEGLERLEAFLSKTKPITKAKK